MQIIKLIFVLLLMANAFFASASALRVAGPHSERVHHTKINAELDTELHKVTASMTLTWKNTTDVTLTEIPFHLYLNAFSSTETTFMQESNGGRLRSDTREGSERENFGYVQVTALSDKDGNDILSNWKMDVDVATLTLTESLAPGQQVEINMDFTSQLPKVFARSGHNGDSFNFVAQWFPKPGVYFDGRWVNHRYHAHSEFFADFGTYDVSITVPSEYVVGATGYMAKETSVEDKTTYQYLAEDVHDFVWTADSNYGVANKEWQGIDIKLLYQKPLDEKSIENQFDAAIASFQWFDDKVGLYPYSTMTLVQPPEDGSGAGGMEYPTLVTTITNLDYSEYNHSAAMVTIHEIGHNYWQGIFASNEFEESWMDEGINSYTEGRIMSEALKQKHVMQFEHMGVDMPMAHHMGTAALETLDPVKTNSWSFINSRAYAANSYSKPATILNTVERVWGTEKVDQVLQNYYRHWAFKHPTTEDFLEIAAAVDQDMADYLADAITTTKTVDLMVKTIKSVEAADFVGYTFESGEVAPEFTGSEVEEDAEVEGEAAAEASAELPDAATGDEQQTAQAVAQSEETEQQQASQSEPDSTTESEQTGETVTVYKNTVTLARMGELMPPQVDVLLTYDNGDTETRQWLFEADKPWQKWQFTTEQKLVEVMIDPEFKVLLDKNLANNTKRLRSESKQSWKWVISLFQTMQHTFSAILPL